MERKIPNGRDITIDSAVSMVIHFGEEHNTPDRIAHLEHVLSSANEHVLEYIVVDSSSNGSLNGIEGRFTGPKYKFLNGIDAEILPPLGWGIINTDPNSRFVNIVDLAHYKPTDELPDLVAFLLESQFKGAHNGDWPITEKKSPLHTTLFRKEVFGFGDEDRINTARLRDANDFREQITPEISNTIGSIHDLHTFQNIKDSKRSTNNNTYWTNTQDNLERNLKVKKNYEPYIAFGLTAVSSPLMAIIPAAIKAEDIYHIMFKSKDWTWKKRWERLKASTKYKQKIITGVDQDGNHTYGITLKYRSMPPGSDKDRSKVVDSGGLKSGVRKTGKDKRRTWLGDMLSEMKLDELPQLQQYWDQRILPKWYLRRTGQDYRLDLIGNRPQIEATFKDTSEDYLSIYTRDGKVMSIGIFGLYQLQELLGEKGVTFEFFNDAQYNKELVEGNIGNIDSFIIYKTPDALAHKVASVAKEKFRSLASKILPKQNMRYAK